MDENVGAPLVGAHENISRVEPNENNQGPTRDAPTVRGAIASERMRLLCIAFPLRPAT